MRDNSSKTKIVEKNSKSKKGVGTVRKLRKFVVTAKFHSTAKFRSGYEIFVALRDFLSLSSSALSTLSSSGF